MPDSRERRIRATVPCPQCGAAIGQACRKGIHPHDPRRGIEDLRPQMHRAHEERKQAWQAARDAALTSPLASPAPGKGR